MRKAEIKVGELYEARVNGKYTTVRVDAIDYVGDGFRISGNGRNRRPNTLAYRVTNLATGKKTTFRSAAKFRGPAKVEIATHDPNRAITGQSADTVVIDDPTLHTTGLVVGPLGGLTTETASQFNERMRDAAKRAEEERENQYPESEREGK